MGLCKNCRKTEKYCDDCVYLLTISMKDSSVIRCIKYGYELPQKKDWKTAANCPDFTPKIKTKTPKTKKKPKKSNRRIPTENNPFSITIKEAKTRN